MADAVINYGRDTSCTDHYRPGRFVTGARLVAEALYRRFTTAAGTLQGGPDEEDFGLDLSRMIGAAASTTNAATWPARIQNEALKDERVESCAATVTAVTDSAGQVTYDITIEGMTGAGPFALQLNVSAVTVTLVGLTA